MEIPHAEGLHRRVRRRGSQGLLLAGLLLAACATGRAPAPSPAPPGTASRGEYVIGTADILRVSVWRNPELSADVPVRPDGMISVPLVNEVRAEGKTPSALKEELTRRMSEFITNPEITVVVLEVNSKRAHVLGEVVRSGPVSLETDMRVLDAIAAAGGFGPFANKDDVRVIRRTENGEVEYRFDYGAYIKGDAPNANLLLEPGDTVVVPD